jgi:hypothetical protein
VLWTFEKLENPYRAIVVECSTAEALPDRDYGPEYETFGEAMSAGDAWVSAMAGGADGRWFLFPPGLRWEYIEIEGGAIKRATNWAMRPEHAVFDGNFEWIGDVNFDDLTRATDEQAAAVLALTYDYPEKIAVFKLID